jgi:Zn-finger nucleic acid-binding protein
MSERQGIEIDYCPQCRGVWLDRGELDKILERSAAAPPQHPPSVSRPEYRVRDRDDDDEYRGHKRRKGWLEELFD